MEGPATTRASSSLALSPPLDFVERVSTPGNHFGVSRQKRCVNDGAFSLAWEYGTTETVLTSSDDATKKPRIVCSASAKLRPEFARVAGAGRRWDRHELMACGDNSHPSETISLLGSADGPRGRAECAARLVCSSLSPGPLRQPISHAYLPCP